MKCEQCRPLLAALSGGDLAKADSERARAHLATCAACSQHLQELRETVGLLRKVGRSEPLPADFTAALHRRLASTPPPERPLAARLWGVLERLGLDSGPRLGVATAVGLLGVLLLSPLPLRRASDGASGSYLPGRAEQAEHEVAAAFRVPSRRVAVVHLDFVADVPVDDVEFEVTLPTGLNFVDAGQPVAEHTLQWRGSLALGRNPIPLAVRGVKPGRYRVTAQARGSGIEVRHDILLEVVPS